MVDMFNKYDNIPEGYIPTNSYWPKPCTEVPVAKLITRKIPYNCSTEVVFQLNNYFANKLEDKELTLYFNTFRGEEVLKLTSTCSNGIVKFVIGQEEQSKLPSEVYFLILKCEMDGGSIMLYSSTSEVLTVI